MNNKSQSTAPSEQPTVAAPDAWMREDTGECASAARKRWMENADFGVWDQVAALYSKPLFFTAPTPTTVAAGQSIADDVEFNDAFASCVNHYSFEGKARLIRIIDARSPVAAGQSIADDAELVVIMDAAQDEWGAGNVAGGLRLHVIKSVLKHLARSPVSGQACEVREAVSGEFPPLPEPFSSLTIDGNPVFKVDQLHAYVLADRGIRGKASDAEDGADAARFRYLIDQLPCSIAAEMECGISEIAEQIDQQIVNLAESREKWLKERAARAQQQGADHG